MQLQKDLTLKHQGQLEFNAPVHKGDVKPILKNRNAKKSFKKHINLISFGVDLPDTPGLDKF